MTSDIGFVTLVADTLVEVVDIYRIKLLVFLGFYTRHRLVPEFCGRKICNCSNNRSVLNNSSILFVGLEKKKME